jgi:uncharacterized protein
MHFHFEWDPLKATKNLRNHGVSFDEARTVFNDPLARIFDDPEHSADEAREIIIGHSIMHRLLIVPFTERGSAIRVISARVATKREQRDYEENVLF